MGKVIEFKKNEEPLIQKQTLRRPTVIAIGGGKGGIGKTIVSTNLGISLVWRKKKVVLVDADLGGANLHTCFGIKNSAATLSDYLSGACTNIHDAVVQTDVPGLKLISGAHDSLSVANITNQQKLRFLTSVRKLDADYVVLDLGAGTTYSVIDFFLIADRGILVMLPEPTSVENVYRFLKVAFYRKLRSIERSRDLGNLVSEIMNRVGDENIKTPHELLDLVREQTQQGGEALYTEMLKFKPKIIVNMVRTSSDIDMGASVSFACKKYFGIDVDYLGHIQYSNHIWQSVRNRRPHIIDFPNSNIVSNFSNIVKKIVGVET